MAMSGNLAFELTQQFAEVHGYQPNTSEIRSWERSLPALMRVLLEAGLDEVTALIEYTLPLTSRRTDVILAGTHPETGAPSFVVVELKQWSRATPDAEDPALCHVDGYRRAVLNPIEQVRAYCRYLVSFNAALAANPERVSGAAYLHNATASGVGGLQEVGLDTHGQLFTGNDRKEFIDFLRRHLSPASGSAAVDELVNAKAVPSKQLMAVAADEVRDREQFVLLDEQLIAYRTVMNAVQKAREADSKEVVVVTGGPGTGKSVIALSLLGELYRQGRPALHATGSQSFTKTMRKVAGARKPQVQDLFKYFNSFMTAERNALDVVICDEAHRMRETSANRYTPARLRSDRPQVAELIDAARVPVFLLDEHQIVRPGEMGSVPQIEAAAAAKGLSCTVIRLEDQFRCGGSDAYLRWVLRLLGLEPGGPVPWQADGKMQLLVADSPAEMEAFLSAKREKYGARMSAGFCWKWTKDVKPGRPLPDDVVIGDWARPWNVYGDRGIDGAPPSALWATNPAGFGQVGCVYTAQGFEYDWSGVIMGPDLVWRSDHWVAHRSESKDPVFKRSVPEDTVGLLIRNTYKVLLTRGMIGTVLYSTDPETQEKLRELVGSHELVAAR
ncbi:DUF2075 domain-containing protein [Streptomyces sp. NPDC047002]|uniref:DUF2075 domain-containing protein n=1 Tax=Streptomyces sp. NPDC047002 TaxID=3155475 RepID=UPI003455C534